MPVKSQLSSADHEREPDPRNGKKLSKREIKMEEGRYMIFYTAREQHETEKLATDENV
jgi:hypothetical protein